MKMENVQEVDLSGFGRLVVILEDWAHWNSRYAGVKASSRSVGLTSGYTSSKTFDDMLDEVENSIAELVESAVDDLPSGQAAAINTCYGLCSVFRYPRGNYADLLLDAHEALMVALPKKGVVI